MYVARGQVEQHDLDEAALRELLLGGDEAEDRVHCAQSLDVAHALHERGAPPVPAQARRTLHPAMLYCAMLLEAQTPDRSVHIAAQRQTRPLAL